MFNCALCVSGVQRERKRKKNIQICRFQRVEQWIFGSSYAERFRLCCCANKHATLSYQKWMRRVEFGDTLVYDVQPSESQSSCHKVIQQFNSLFVDIRWQCWFGSLSHSLTLSLARYVFISNGEYTRTTRTTATNKQNSKATGARTRCVWWLCYATTSWYNEQRDQIYLVHSKQQFDPIDDDNSRVINTKCKHCTHSLGLGLGSGINIK